MKNLVFLLSIFPILLLGAVPPPIVRSSFTTNTSPAQMTNFFNVADYGILAGGAVDQSAKMLVLLTNVYNAGGGTIQFNAGTYLFTNKWLLVNDGAIPPHQPSIRITGAGSFFTGQSYAPNGGTILEMRNTNAVAKIDTRGLGHLEIDHVTLRNTGGQNGTPFIQTTFTTLSIHNCGFYGNAQGLSAREDAVVLGGTNTDFATSAADASFQGYGTVIFDNYFNRIRRGVYFRAHCNAVVVKANTWWSECGGDGPAIELYPGPDNSGCIGNVVSDNLIEMPGYTNGIICRGATANTFVANNFYDPPGGWQGTAYLFTNFTGAFSSGNTVLYGFVDSGLNVMDVSAGQNIFTSVAGLTNVVRNYYDFKNNVRANGPNTIQYIDNLGNFSYRAPQNNGWIDYFVPVGGGAEAQYRAIRGSATTTTLTLSGSATATLGAAAILALSAPTISMVGNVSIPSGANQRAGNLVLVGGTKTVSNTSVTANTVVLLTRKTSGGTIGTAITYTLSAGVSFTVTSDNVLDTSTFSYLLVEVP